MSDASVGRPRAVVELNGIEKRYVMGDNVVYALRGVSLRIEEGDFVAIMGPSGSGKSTMLNMLGLLDVPDAGSYRLDGKEVAQLSEDDLAVARRDTIGFIFQQFNLLPRVSALENVSLPLLYSERKHDFARARGLLDKVGLGKRTDHRPNELSGGQQQRVAIARALVNRPRVILADEPTGNLDSKSQTEILALLKELNATQGITVIVVTHEEEVGQEARRLIRMRDGLVQSDERLDTGAVASSVGAATTTTTTTAPALARAPRGADRRFALADLVEHFQQGLRTLASNKIRTGLSMLGILIGVGAVVAMLALGRGAQTAIESQLASLGSNLLALRPGVVRSGGVALDRGAVTRLGTEDADVIRERIPSVKDAAAVVNGKAQVTFQNKNWSTQVMGTGASYAEMHAQVPELGRYFIDDENLHRARVAAIGMTVVRELFGEQNPIGEMIKINRVLFTVIGVLPEKGATGWRDQDDIIMIPVETAMHRLMGKTFVDNIDIEIRTPDEIDEATEQIQKLMISRHKVPASQNRDEAFSIRNMADIKEALQSSSRTMSLLLASIAAISLLVGGIGIMNIMLVSVTERTREIGLRKAVGARRADILTQFLVESVVVSTIGGLLGIFLGWIVTVLLSTLAGWATSISPGAVLLSFFFSATTGVVFGIYPARKASLLPPIEALRYE